MSNIVAKESSSSSVNAAATCLGEELQFHPYLQEVAASANAATYPYHEDEELQFHLLPARSSRFS